jgi:hypothetical protein
MNVENHLVHQPLLLVYIQVLMGSAFPFLALSILARQQFLLHPLQQDLQPSLVYMKLKFDSIDKQHSF